MKYYNVRLLAISLILFVSQTVSASIDPSAPSASHHLESAVAAMHEHLHHHYDSSYGSHDLEVAADELHGVLHDWSEGNATEAEVVMSEEAVKRAWNSFRQSIVPAGVLNAGDTGLDTLYETIKAEYKALRFLLRKAK